MGIMTCRTFKSKGGAAQGRGEWSNTYHFNQPEGDLTLANIDDAVTAVFNFEKAIHLSDTVFDRAVVSTYEKEGRRGHPEAVRVLALAGVGSRAIGATNPAPLIVTTDFRSLAATGRSGIHRYRNCVDNSDVETGSDGNMEFIAGHTEDFLAPPTTFVNAMADNGTPLLMPLTTSTDGTPYRQFTAMSLAGLSTKQLRNNKRPSIPTTDGGLIHRAIKVIEEIGSITAGVSVVRTVGTAISPVILDAIAALGAGAEAILPDLLALL